MISELLASVQKVNEGLQNGTIVRDVLVGHEDDILELQKQQLFEGKTSSGDDFRPFYSEDLQPGGYFKNKESAKRYADWKQTINYPIQASRNPDAPNLYINGRFHSELGVEFGTEAVAVDGRTIYAKQIMAKYGNENFGLTPENWNVVFNERGAKDELINEIKTELWNASH